MIETRLTEANVFVMVKITHEKILRYQLCSQLMVSGKVS
jgi:hypothetical protein